MTTLIEVLAHFFGPFGYEARTHESITGRSGRNHPIPLTLEKDARRVAVAAWLHSTPVGETFAREFIDAVGDTGCDAGLLVSLGATPDAVTRPAKEARVHVWDSRRLAQELGDAVLRETCPDQWTQRDPLLASKPSRIMDAVQTTAPAPVPEAARELPVTPQAEPAFPTTAPTAAAQETDHSPETLEVPAAFGLFDAVESAPQQAPAPTESAPPASSAPAAEMPFGLWAEPAQVPAAATPSMLQPTAAAPSMHPATARAEKPILRLQVTKELARSLAKPKTRTIDQLFLRLVPHHVYDFEAHVLVEGSLNAERKTGRMAIDASRKRVAEWPYALETSRLEATGVDIDEKPVRASADDGRDMIIKELQRLVTRDVTMQEDDSEWSVTVKKKVELAEDEVTLNHVGTYWVPVWRVAGEHGHVEIDAATGQFLLEEIAEPQHDSVLI